MMIYPAESESTASKMNDKIQTPLQFSIIKSRLVSYIRNHHSNSQLVNLLSLACYIVCEEHQTVLLVVLMISPDSVLVVLLIPTDCNLSSLPDTTRL